MLPVLSSVKTIHLTWSLRCPSYMTQLWQINGPYKMKFTAVCGKAAAVCGGAPPPPAAHPGLPFAEDLSRHWSPTRVIRSGLRWSLPAHLCLRWSRPAHLGLRWSCPARLLHFLSAPRVAIPPIKCFGGGLPTMAHGGPGLAMAHGDPGLTMAHGRSAMAAQVPGSAMAAWSATAAWVPWSSMTAWVPWSTMAAWVPWSTMATRTPCSALGPGTGTALEATCPGSRSLEASRAPPPPSPLDVIRHGDAPIGRGGGLMSDFVFLFLVFPHPYMVLPVSCH